MTIFMTVALLFAAVVVDGGMYYVQKRDMQGNADAAALAAVRELPTSPSAASARANEYARNGGGGTLENITLSDSNRTVTVTVGTVGESSFGDLIGIDAPPIRARATARVQMMGPRPGMLPLAFLRDTFTIGVDYEVKFDNNATGNRGAIAPDMEPNCGEARGASDFADLIKGEAYGGHDACATPIAETLDTEPGTMAGPTRTGFDARMGTNHESFDDVFDIDPSTGLHIIARPNSPRIGIVPIIEHMNGSATWPSGRSQPIRIVGYMLVYIGKRDSPPSYPSYTDNGRSVWVTPVHPILPTDFPDGTLIDYETGSPSPVVFRLTD